MFFSKWVNLYRYAAAEANGERAFLEALGPELAVGRCTLNQVDP
jgi:hypothetical protein